MRSQIWIRRVLKEEGRKWGRLFGDRYKAVLVEGESGYYYETLLDYIHLNPVRAGLVKPKDGQSVMDYRWSSLWEGYAQAKRKRAIWLDCAEGLQVYGFPDTTAGRRKMVERLDRCAVEEESRNCGVPLMPEEVDARCSHLRKGWYWGTQEFSDRMLKRAKGEIGKPRSRGYRSAEEQQAHGVQQAERWIQEGLRQAGVTVKELKRLKGSDVRKVVLAEFVRRNTSVSNVWLAEQLEMKSAANVSQQLARAKTRRRKIEGQVPKGLLRYLKSVKS